MRSNRNHWLSAIILSTLLAATAALAQNPDGNAPPPPPAGGPEMQEGHKQHMDEMAKALALTDTQKDQLKQVHQDEKAKLDALRADTSLTRDQKRSQLKAIRLEARQKLNTILSPEQQEKMKKFRAQRKGKMGGRGGRRRGPPPNGAQGPGPSNNN